MDTEKQKQDENTINNKIVYNLSNKTMTYIHISPVMHASIWKQNMQDSPVNLRSYHISKDTCGNILYNYGPKWRWLAVDIYQAAKRQSKYPPLVTNTEGDNCFITCPINE